MRKLDLRSGKPVWQAYRSPAIARSTLTRSLTTDVLIVGTGITGAMTAELLSEDGHEVILVDRRGAALGSTPATTALVQHEIDVPLSKLQKAIGAEKAFRAWRRSKLAVANLRGQIESLEIACRMTDRQTLYLAGNVLSGNKLRDEADVRASAGLPAQYLTASELAKRFGIDRDGAILSTGNFVVDPVKLTKGLLLQAQRRGAQLFAPEEASAIKFHKSSIEITMRSGHRIVAGHVILATGYELMDVVHTDRHDIISTWAIATKRQPKDRLWPGEAMIWEASDPYLYVRTTHDGRVICGGEDEDFQDEQTRDKLLAKKTQRIVDKLSKLLPGIDPMPEFAWAGSFGTTPTGLPLIGPVHRRPRLFSLMGYGGNGITYARIAAEVVRNKLAGREDSDADLYALSNRVTSQTSFHSRVARKRAVRADLQGRRP